MIPIEYRIENEDESVTLDFKREIYNKDKNHEFLKDIVALANALSNDTYRYIIIGVKEQSGFKEYFDVKRDDVGDVANYQQLIDQNIEPNIPISIEYVEINDKNLAIFKIGPCDNAPYMFKKDYRKIKQGMIYIRTGTSTRFAKRQELDLMYQNRQKINRKDIIVGFNEKIDATLELLALSETEIKNIPSKVRRKEIQNEIHHRKMPYYNRNISQLMSSSMMWLDREKPLSSRDDDELQQMLVNVDREYRDHNNYYLFEEVGHRLNLFIHNKGNEPLKNCTIKLRIPIKDGFYIANDIYDEPENYSRLINNYQQSRYPIVEKKESLYIITEKINTIKQKLPTELFQEEIRLVIFPKFIDSNISIQYEIYADNYPEVINGNLSIKVIKS
ncbi:AlbA family DNA-binding domain-containing protein [Virgibacillus dokdonensis]|uniref:AlbA family DNA-binding domain-containing protein n=1 Tax=Virgibacillus dokdonensis TaxID=302167 RepID=UPI0015910898|nr:ATP-binding protein [Virgibacillus dokdonensis]